MKLTVQQVFDTTQVIGKLIDANRPMPQKGKYRLARLHAKLVPEWTTINDRRSSMIMAYGHMNDDGQPAVPEEKMTEFVEAWKEFAQDEIEVDVQPIPLECLDLGDSTDGAVSALELLALGELVAE